MPSLFDPVTLGSIACPNRILMAPCTRGRADPNGFIPTPIMGTYYAQRASAGQAGKHRVVYVPVHHQYCVVHQHSPDIQLHSYLAILLETYFAHALLRCVVLHHAKIRKLCVELHYTRLYLNLAL